MSLDQLQALKVWHQRHWREHPVERLTWDAVLTLWLMGWVGMPAALLAGHSHTAMAAFVLLFLPAAYAALRQRLHRRGRLRCDWLTSLR